MSSIDSSQAKKRPRRIRVMNKKLTSVQRKIYPDRENEEKNNFPIARSRSLDMQAHNYQF